MVAVASIYHYEVGFRPMGICLDIGFSTYNFERLLKDFSESVELFVTKHLPKIEKKINELKEYGF